MATRTGLRMRRVHRVVAVLALPLAAIGFVATQSAESASDLGPKSARARAAAALNPAQLGQITGLRRLTESQYRNSIADIFGPDISVVGRFEPIVRPKHQLIATGAGESTISPAGLEQFDAIGRGIASQVFDAAHRDTFVKCKPADATKPDHACAREALVPIGRLLFRRPLTETEQGAFVQMANVATVKSGDFYNGVQLALGAMLVSPNFLYIVESAAPDAQGNLALDNYSRASRLSYLLWDTTPDPALLDTAAKGQLTDPAKLAAIAKKMVASPRLEAGVRAFFADMLLFEKFDEVSKDPIVYPRFNPDVAKALPEQMLRMIADTLVTRGADYRELFTTRRTYVNRALGPIYNVPVQSRKGWDSYEFPADSDRAGLLSQAGFLALYSHSGRSSPTLRGRAIRELLLCQPVPDPPGNVNFSVVQDTNNMELRTARLRLSAHATDPVCASCHRITDPIGLTLEGFDGIGVYRKQENAADIDVKGSFEGSDYLGAAGLGKALAASPSSTECVASRMLEYATGRAVDSEATMLADVEKGFAADQYRFRSLMLRVAIMPEAYRVGGKPSAADHASLSAQTRKGGAR